MFKPKDLVWLKDVHLVRYGIFGETQSVVLQAIDDTMEVNYHPLEIAFLTKFMKSNVQIYLCALEDSNKTILYPESLMFPRNNEYDGNVPVSWQTIQKLYTPSQNFKNPRNKSNK